MVEEVWRDVKLYEGKYQVSNLGRIKSLERVVKLFHGGTFVKKEIILTPNKDKKGYLRVDFIPKRIENNSRMVHRIVANAFIENPNNLPQVNHINGIKDDNNVDNLEWVTSKENCIHSFAIGLQKGKSGLLNGMSKKVAKCDLYGNILDV
jgi:hypothetical protein